MKEAIRMVLESIYDPEFPDTSHFRSGRGSHSALRRIKEEWGSSRWFLEFEVRKCFHTIDRHRFIPILKEEIDDPKFFDPIQKLFSAGRLVGGEKGPDSVPHSVLLSALLGNIYLNKLDQEIGRIRQKHEIPLVQRIRSVLSKKSIDDHSGEEASFNAPQDNRAVIVGRDEFPLKATFHSLVSSWHTPPFPPRSRGDQKRPFVFPPVTPPAAFLNKPSSLLCVAFLIEAAGFTQEAIAVSSQNKKSREGASLEYASGGDSRSVKKNLAIPLVDNQYCKRKGLLIELGGETISFRVVRSERGLARKLAPSKTHYWRRICYARYADDSLLGIVGAVELLIEIQKRITHFNQSGLNLWGLPAGSTTIAARSTVEFLGTVIREVPPRTTPIPFLRELEKRLRVKHRVHITACHLRSTIYSKWGDLGEGIPIKELTQGMSGTGSLLDAVPLSETSTQRTAGVRSPQVFVSWGIVKHIRQGSRGIEFLQGSGRSNVLSDVKEAVSRSGVSARKFEFYTPAGRKAAGEGGGHWAGSFHSEFPIQIEAPVKKILRRLRDRGLISRRRPWPIHVACLTNVSDGDIVNWSAGIAISPLSYYRCCDNLYQVRRIVDHQIRWSALFTLAHKHKCSARNIIPKYSKDSNIVNQEGGQTLAEFPNSIELGKLGPGRRSDFVFLRTPPLPK
jgi:hypothetical protein